MGQGIYVMIREAGQWRKRCIAGGRLLPAIEGKGTGYKPAALWVRFHRDISRKYICSVIVITDAFLNSPIVIRPVSNIHPGPGGSDRVFEW